MNFLLDTVTISELRRGVKAHPRVQQWQMAIAEVWLSVVTLNELRFGIKNVERRDPVFAGQLNQWYAGLIAQPDRFRLLNVDRTVAEVAGDLRGDFRMPYNDALIAATAKVHGLILATRNVSDFKNAGISLVNPWDDE